MRNNCMHVLALVNNIKGAFEREELWKCLVASEDIMFIMIYAMPRSKKS